MKDRNERAFTGWHMLGVMVAFFGTIVAVNLTMATLATKSWTGQVVKSSYVAGQEFNRKAEEGRAQAALGWTSTLAIGDGKIRYGLVDANASRVEPRAVTVTLRRPTSDAEDRTLKLERIADGAFAASQTPPDGVWIVEIDADIGSEHPFREVRRVVVENGAIK